MARATIAYQLIGYLKKQRTPMTTGELAAVFGRKRESITSALGNYVKTHPDGEIVRLKTGTYRYVTNADRKAREKAAVAREANAAGYHAKSADDEVNTKMTSLAAPDRGSGTYVRVLHSDADEGAFFFVLNGKMWKAYQI